MRLITTLRTAGGYIFFLHTMRKLTFLAALFALAINANAQSATDPVLMTINGKPITKAEFEYSFHKNGNVDGTVEKKTVKDYVPMFVNYKLKVAEAEALQLDTMQSFRKEFQTYRDMQLTPYMVDWAFIDSTARMIYDNTVLRLNGKDLIETSHILIKLKQNATADEKLQTKAKADSIYQVLLKGADFVDLAKRFSDDKGSAIKGGRLPMVGPGSFVKEFEDAAYQLQNGQMAAPVLSPFGYHIIKMEKRQPLDPYDKAKTEIITLLKRQNIEEASSEHHIQKLVEASNGRLTREAVLDSVMQAQVKNNPDLRYLIQEYHDGLLLYEISKKQIWDTAANDSVALEKWYKKHKQLYAWKKPRFKGYVYHCKDPKQAKAVKKMLKKYLKQGSTDWRKELKQQFNKDSIMVSINGPYLCHQGENPYIDAYVFKNGQSPQPLKGFAYSNAYGKKLKQPASYLDAKPQVTTDYQAHLEQLWIDSLRKKFNVTIDEAVLSTIK